MIGQFIKIAFIFIAFLLSVNGSGQGCSDAGACSIGSLEEEAFQTNGEDKIIKLRLSAEQSIGLGEKFTFISQTTISAELRISKQTSLQIRTPFIFTSGNLGNSSGIGDVLVSVVQQIFQTGESQFGLLAGGKIRSNNANLSFAGQPLPMAYQTSLGTYDIIFGLQYLWKTWDFYLGYQHPFGRNQNDYLHPPGETDESKLYFESASLKRGDDLALRVQKTFNLENNQSIQPGIMPIFRIQRSEIARFDENVLLENSDGLTLNLYLTYVKKLRGSTMLYLTGAFPVIDRDYRADGLTRNFVLTMRIASPW